MRINVVNTEKCIASCPFLAIIFFKTYYQNIHGLRTKFNTIRHNFPIFGTCDVIILTETFLTPDIHDSELGFAGFQIV